MFRHSLSDAAPYIFSDDTSEKSSYIQSLQLEFDGEICSILLKIVPGHRGLIKDERFMPGAELICVHYFLIYSAKHGEVEVPKEEEVVGSDVEKKRHLNGVFIGHVGESHCQ